MAELNENLMGTGIVVFHVNVNLDFLDKIRPQELVDMVRENHIDDVARLKEAGWHCMWLPCVGEASRVEKIDLKKPSLEEIALATLKEKTKQMRYTHLKEEEEEKKDDD
tara:strand:- start:12266 stop:12592 length:327 start_codon:yes stop_codon:yes gene_type:complete